MENDESLSKTLPQEIQWRGSKYVLQAASDGCVKWYNPVSRWSQKCSVEAWKAGNPYGDKCN